MEDINAGTGFRQEGEKAFPIENTESANSAESSSEKTATDQSQSQAGDNAGAADKGNKDGGGDTNFLDHPRWKEREADWNKRFNDQETRHVEELDKIRKEIAEKTGNGGKSADAGASEQPPAWFGGDAGQWAEFQKWNEGLISKAREGAVNEIKSKTEAEQKAIKDATDYFDQTVTALEADKTLNPTGEKIDRNKLLKIALDNDLVDSQGRWNYKAAFHMMRNAGSSKTSTDEKKAVASASTSEKSAESKQEAVTSSTDFKKPGARPW